MQCCISMVLKIFYYTHICLIYELINSKKKTYLFFILKIYKGISIYCTDIKNKLKIYILTSKL